MSSSQIYLGVVGVGGVGTAFLGQLSRLPNPPSLVLLARTTQTLTSGTGYSPAIAASDWQSALSSPAVTTSGAITPPKIVSYLQAAPGHSILVDNTSDPSLASAYPLFLRAGISIVTPNKKAFSSDLSLWKDIFSAAASGSALVYHESTVGAGLPVVSTLRDLVATGDQVTRIEGVFSGTLSFLFNTFAPAAGSVSSSTQWSEVVARAKQLGYTEPDPRDDLNGMDVARKLTILARIAGLDVESPDSFPVESLIPAELASLPTTREGIDQFMARLPDFDTQMSAVKEKAEKSGKVVRYVGRVDVVTKQVSVGLQSIDGDSAIARLKGSDNIISFYTKRYGDRPMIIQGAGAGADVTAMGVTADLIKVMERLK